MKKVILFLFVVFVFVGGGLAYWFWEDILYWWHDGDYYAEAEYYVDEEYGYYELPEDCYEDEYYDYEDQLCYIDEEFDDDLLIQFFGLVDVLLDVSGEDFENSDSLSEEALVTYDIDGNLIVNPIESTVSDDLLAYQKDIDTHQKIWVYYANLIPPEQRSTLTNFVIFTDGPDEVMAAVEQDDTDPQKWVLAVDIADAGNPQELTYTLIHEFGHLLTLNSSQVEPDTELFEDPENEALYDQAASACPQYFPGEGCSEPGSYINLFFQRFWADLFDEWDEINYVEDDDEYYELLDNFYGEHQDQFVTDYAATNPGEDIAESWTYFVLQPKPAGNSVSEEKVLFFYEFPELVELREQIVLRTFTRLRRQ